MLCLFISQLLLLLITPARMDTGSQAELVYHPQAVTHSSTNWAQHRATKLVFDRAFSHAGPAAWNSLPDELRQTPTFNSFKCDLKTRLFTTAF